MNAKFYKCCAVPMCNSTTITTPEKLFIHVPKVTQIRRKWLRLARRDIAALTTTSTAYFCEDHFDLSLKCKVDNEATLIAEIDGRAVISRVYHYLDKEYQQLKSLTNNSYDLSLLVNTLKRTATATGVSEQLITEILEQELSEDDEREAQAEKCVKVDCEDQPEAGSSKVNDIEELNCEGEDYHLRAEEGCDPLRSPSLDGSSDTTHDEVKMEIEEHPLELAEDLIESPACASEHQEPPVTTHVAVKTEPADDQTHPHQVQFGTQMNPADYASIPALHTEVKIEPTDEKNPQQLQEILPYTVDNRSSSSTHHVTPDPPPSAELKTIASGRNTNRALTAATKEQIVVMFGQKHFISEIARKLQISTKAVKHWLARYRDSGDLDRLPPGPQPIVFTDASSIHREVVARHLSDPHASTRSTATALNLSMQTVRNHLLRSLRRLRSLLPAKRDPSKQGQPQISWQKVGDTENHTANSNNITAAPTNPEVNLT